MENTETDHLTPGQLTKLNRVTEITWNELEEDVKLETPDRRQWRRLEKLGCTPVYQNKSVRQYKIPKSWIRIAPPPRKKTLSERQRRQRAKMASERFKKKAPETQSSLNF